MVTTSVKEETQLTSVFWKLYDAWMVGNRHIWLEGGTAASKTFSVLQLLTQVASRATRPIIISVVSETTPHLKRGCIRDFQNIMGSSFNSHLFNKTDLIYDFGLAKLEFFSADQPAKLRGARRDILFVNEANNIAYDGFTNMDARTRVRTIADWNPVSEFWYHQHNLGKEPDSAYIHATYRDAGSVIPASVIKNILAIGAKDPYWADVYLEGKLREAIGLVYPAAFGQVDVLPRGPAHYGLDFGFSGDPAVVVKNVLLPGELYSQQIIFEPNLTNPQLADKMIAQGVQPHYDIIWADESEPKSIQELCDCGLVVKPCPKGRDSVEFGHQKVRQFKQYWTKDSLDCIREQRNFRYLADKDSKLTKQTAHQYSHGMDARRYGVVGATGPAEPQEKIIVFDSMQLLRGV